MTADKNFIKRDQVAAILIPGLVQYKNNQEEKGIVIFIWVIGTAFICFFYPTYWILPIFAAVIYFYGIFDSLLIYRDLNRKRRSISYDAKKISGKA